MLESVQRAHYPQIDFDELCRIAAGKLQSATLIGTRRYAPSFFVTLKP